MKNKLFSSALIFDDMKTIVASTGITIAIFILMSLHYFFSDNSYYIETYSQKFQGTNYFSAVDMNVINIVIVIAIITFIILYSNKESNYSYLLTQPISRDSIILTKSLNLFLSYTIPLLFYGIMSSILISMNAKVSAHIKLQAYGYMFKHVIMIFALTTFLVTLLQLLQMLFGKITASIIMPCLIIFFLFLEVSFLYVTASPKIEFIRTFIRYICNILFSGEPHKLGVIYIIINYFALSKTIGIILFLIASVIFLILAFLLNRKVKYENFSNIFMFKIVKKLFKIIASALVVPIIETIIAVIATIILIKVSNIVDLNIHLSNNMEHIILSILEYILVLINIAWIPLTFLVYKFISKIEKKRMVA